MPRPRTEWTEITAIALHFAACPSCHRTHQLDERPGSGDEVTCPCGAWGEVHYQDSGPHLYRIKWEIEEGEE